MTTETETRTADLNAIKNQRLKHIVELDAQGQPSDQCLCGYVWDVLRPKPEGEICKPCVDEARRRGWIG